MKTDARVRYTKKVLKDALLKLMKTKSIKQITVTEVCEIAELNRATFYTHYTDCYDLLEQIENELLRDFKDSLKYINTFNVSNLVLAILEMIDKNIDICQTIIFGHTDADIIKKMINLTRKLAISYWKKELSKATDNDLEMLYSCLANGLVHVVIDGYNKYKHEEITSFVNKFVNSALKQYI